MRIAILVALGWLTFDAMFVVLLCLRARTRAHAVRAQIDDMIAAAERYANQRAAASVRGGGR
jgi:hypothetical protein